MMVYVNKQAQRAKSIYAGYVNENWYFYNLDKSPTTTAVKLINKSTNDIAATFANSTKAGIVTKTGTAVAKIVEKVGTQVENTAQKIKTTIKSTVGAAVKSAVQKVVQSVADKAKEALSNFVKNIFSRATGAVIPFDA